MDLQQHTRHDKFKGQNFYLVKSGGSREMHKISVAERKIGIPMAINKFSTTQFFICCTKLHGMEHWKRQETYN